VAERQLRGTVERTYRLVQEATTVDVDELRSMTPDAHRRGFLTFVAGLLAGFDRYLDACGDADGRVDFVADRTGYRTAVMHLSDAEVDGLLAELGEVFARYRDTPPAPVGRVAPSAPSCSRSEHQPVPPRTTRSWSHANGAKEPRVVEEDEHLPLHRAGVGGGSGSAAARRWGSS
jgi:hypothetical protein